MNQEYQILWSLHAHSSNFEYLLNAFFKLIRVLKSSIRE